MKTQLFLIIALLVFVVVCPARGDLWFDGGYNTFDDSYPYINEVWVINDAVLDVVGGEIGKVETTDAAIVNLHNAEIDWLWTNDNSVVNIYGDNTNWLAAYDRSVINLYAYDVTYHPTGGGDWGTEAWLEGTYYSDDTLFEVWLANDDTYSHVNIVPEPISVTLFGLGLLFIRKRR